MNSFNVFLVACMAKSVVMHEMEAGKIWTIQTGHDYGGGQYLDESGYITGFTVDLTREVCAAANIKCRIIWDKYTNCWDSVKGQKSHGGMGLLGGWYDACTAYAVTIDRMAVFDFSMPFFPRGKVFFFTKKGKIFNTEDLTGKIIGFADGYKSDEPCLDRQNIKGTPLPDPHVRHFSNSKEAIDALLNEEIDAMYHIDFAYKDHPEMVKIENPAFNCEIAGNAMMTRKDNEFNSHWNKGFQQIVSSGRFNKFCKEGREKHAGAGEVSPCI